MESALAGRWGPGVAHIGSTGSVVDKDILSHIIRDPIIQLRFEGSSCCRDLPEARKPMNTVRLVAVRVEHLEVPGRLSKSRKKIEKRKVQPG